MPAASTTARVLKIGITSNAMSIQQLSTLAYWKIRARLLRVPGVGNVPMWGEHLEQYLVKVDPTRMRQHGVTLEQTMDATSASLDAGLLRYVDGNRIGTGGFLNTPNQELPVQHVLPIVTPRDLANVVISTRGNRLVRIGDVATVNDGTMPLAGDAVINGNPGLLLIVEKYP